MITSNLDTTIAVIIIFFSACGLIRGFLKETSSVLNWFGSFYLTSVIKPIVKPFFEEKIQIQFLLDTIINVVVFILLVVILSILTNYLTIILKKIIPSNINNSLGLIFGFIKGFLISSLIIAFIKIMYNKSTNKPDWLQNSYVYNSISYDENFFINMINNIFGSYIKENDNMNENQNNEKIENINENKKYLNNRFNKNYNDEKIENKDELNNKDILKEMINEDTIKKIDESIDNLKENISYKEKSKNEKSLERLINIVID